MCIKKQVGSFKATSNDILLNHLKYIFIVAKVCRRKERNLVQDETEY